MKAIIIDLNSEVQTYENISDVIVPETRDEPFVLVKDEQDRTIAVIPVDLISGIFLDYEDNEEEENDEDAKYNAFDEDAFNRLDNSFSPSHYWASDR